jgi:hypothetical protein
VSQNSTFFLEKNFPEDPPQYRSDPPIFELRQSPVAITEFMVTVRVSFDDFCTSTNLSAQQVKSMIGVHGLQTERINDGPRPCEVGYSSQIIPINGQMSIKNVTQTEISQIVGQHVLYKTC